MLIALISSQLRTRVASGSYLQRNLTFLDKFAPMLLKRHSKLDGVYEVPLFEPFYLYEVGIESE